MPGVREVLVSEQRRAGAAGGVVMEGRDIGTVVFPETPYKFYIDADAEVRATRRLAQGEKDVIQKRDVLDSQRKNSPLLCAPDALRLPIPPMLLQTLVENALKHGIATLAAGGDLVIRAAMVAEGVRVEVLAKNLPVTCFLDSDFLMVNERLAKKAASTLITTANSDPIKR